ncbi:MAG TPA: hypothetical protein VGV38_11180 [Pyrinomonadaceae bacterium]|nr:hypothetical protein [Pyrinomonadaceae bacterium]
MSAKTKNTKPSARRTQVRELPKDEKRLSKDEQKRVKGGSWLMSPAGSVKPTGN